MANRTPRPLNGARVSILVLALLLLNLLGLVIVGLVASYLPADPYGLQPHLYGLLTPLLAGLAGCVFLWITKWEELRRPLPLALLAGSVLGLFLGSIYNLPYYLGLLLIFGVFGPFMALASANAPGIPNIHWQLDLWLSTLAVLLSLALYGLVAYLVVRRARTISSGLWAALLTAFVTLVVSTATFSGLMVIQSLPIAPRELVPTLISFQYLPLQTLPLCVAQAIHAVAAGLIGAWLARRGKAELSDSQRGG